jgi:two-component system sensor histidine kinase KdpD
MIHVDPVLIEQVLVNLIENAIRYTPAASPIEIVAERTPSPSACPSRIADPAFPRAGKSRSSKNSFALMPSEPRAERGWD